MASDIFNQRDAQMLLENKKIFFFGDSNTRAIYKDLVWLLENGSLISKTDLRTKNESSFANDVRLTNVKSLNSCAYQEVRLYNRNAAYVKLQFLTRVFQERITDMIDIHNPPSVIVINSCLWDISRYGQQGIQEYQNNLKATLELFKKNFPFTKIIWTTTLPPSLKCRGGFLNEETVTIQDLLPFHVLQANECVVKTVKQYEVDILDLHYHFKFLIDFRASDGIHWQPVAVRYMTNLLLTHISICWCYVLPKYIKLEGEYASDYEGVELSNMKVVKYNRNNNLFKKNMLHKNNFKSRKNRTCSGSSSRNFGNYTSAINFSLDLEI